VTRGFESLPLRTEAGKAGSPPGGERVPRLSYSGSDRTGVTINIQRRASGEHDLGNSLALEHANVNLTEQAALPLLAQAVLAFNLSAHVGRKMILPAGT
jgi:hypothetical protein